MNRGSTVEGLVREVIRLASMRPRFMNRGSITAPPVVLNEILLQ